MEKIYRDIRSKYEVDGQSGKYATLYRTKAELLEEFDQEIFEETYLNYNIPVVRFEAIQFPVIVFSELGVDGGVLLSPKASESEIMAEADRRLGGDDPDEN